MTTKWDRESAANLMMKLMKILAVTVMTVMAVGCKSTPEDIVQTADSLNHIACIIDDFEQDDATKVTTSLIGSTSVSTVWNEGDVIGVFPSVGGEQVTFTVASGAGTNNCVFDGRGWGLLSSTKYSAYYPGLTEYCGNHDALKAIQVSYVGQIQHTKSAFEVGSFDYLASTNVSPVFTDSAPSGTCTFNFKHLGVLLVFDLTFPTGGFLSTLELECKDNVFAEAGTVDLSQATAAITPTDFTNVMKLDLGGMSVIKNETVRFYMMIAPATISAPLLRVTTTTGAVMTWQSTSTYTFSAGRAKVITATLQEDEVLELSQNNFAIKYPFNTLKVDITSNKGYTISIPSDCDWVSVNNKSLRHASFDVKINQSASARTANILFKSASSDLTKTLTITQDCPPSNVPIPVSHIMPCCRWNNNGTSFLINGVWNTYHDYADLTQCRNILKTISQAGIRVVSIDFTNQAQWDSQWESDHFKERLENIMQVCSEINMEWFLFIGNLSVPGISYWNGIAERIYNSYAQLGHYHYKDGKPMLLIFMPGTSYNSAINGASAANKTYLKNGDKFTIGTCQVNSAITPKATDGWGYRNQSQSSDGKVRFVCPNSGVAPETWARIDADAWSSRMDWGLQATKYVVIGSYDDTCDAIFWGIADVSASSTACHKHDATINDPYIYYNIVKQKLLGE